MVIGHTLLHILTIQLLLGWDSSAEEGTGAGAAG